MRNRSIALGSIALVAVSIGFVALRRWSPFADRGDARFREFVEAAAVMKERPLDVRPWGGFPYRPIAARVRGESAGRSPSKLSVLAGEMGIAAVERPTTQTLHDLGASQLMLGHPTSAVDHLEAALLRETRLPDLDAAIRGSTDAPLLNDLAAAYFARSETGGRARDLMAAAECALRAERIDPRTSEAWWNQAVVFETMGVPDAARGAWEHFLDLDSTSAWAVEARARLRTLTAPPASQRWEQERKFLLDAAASNRRETVDVLVRRYPEQSRLLVEEELLGRWADAFTTGEKQGAEALTAAASIGDAVAKISADAVARDAVAAVAHATPRDAAIIARGQRAFVAARNLFRSGKHPEAQPMLAAATLDFRRGGSPLAFRAEAFDLTSQYYLGRPAEVVAEVPAILRRLGGSASRYPSVEGQVRWTYGLAVMALGSLDDALEQHRRALTAFERTGETSNMAGLVQAICGDYRAVGDLDNAWSYQIQSFRLASRYASFERGQVVMLGGSVIALRDGYPMVADDLQRGVLARARQSRQPIFICDALVHWSGTLAALGATEEARQALREGLIEWQSVAETAIKSRLRADLEMVRASLSLDRSPRERIAELDTAVEYVAKTKSRSRIARVLLMRARAHRDAGDAAAAERDLSAGIAEVEAQREKTTSDETRLTFLNTAVDLYDEAMHLHLQRGEEGEAFDLLERRRARWLLDRFQDEHGDDIPPVEGWSTLHSQIPQGVAIVSYAVSDRTEAWIATSGALKHVVLPGTPLGLAATVAAWRTAIADGRDDTKQRRLAAEVYDGLVAPIRGYLAGVRGVVFIPDRGLNAVPFPALLDSRTHRYLIEDLVVSVAPSANIYLRCLARARAAPSSSRALIVANPTLAPDLEFLRALSGAEAEASAIASLVDSAVILRRSEATLDHFTRETANADIIHFAGHALVNSGRPELSSLILAPNRDGGGAHLYARDIFRMHLPRTRLAVLAACESAEGRMDGDAPLTLATSFIGGGTAASIASLWPVDDATSSLFFTAFYRKLREGLAPADALRDAQIGALRGGNIPQATWAAYVLIGGSPI